MASLQRINPCLWYDNQAEEAARFYVSVFRDSSLGAVSYYSAEGHDIHGRPAGSVMTVEFVLEGQSFLALNGGPQFTFTEAISLMINCHSQEEIDYYWDALTANGGQPSECGWLKDRFGVSWQVAPVQLDELLRDPDRRKADRVMHAMLQMQKIDLAEIMRAAEGA
ncbi:VOC family protein [Hymenobacter gummosus]|uniref:VOC family protein n=1 Tax=Hymenobacter gummosus TaxID=1776032 RepID=A0A3S0JBN1_9BACT|nr:VOC family protein [Hymenobacter gummosus]RTQ46749.1 VOC family protein [Hymenobacter gummosus]